MHFWINKPAGRYYGSTGRRYPATPMPKTRFNRCQRSGEQMMTLRQTMTPTVHQFHGLSNATGNTWRSMDIVSCRSVGRSSARARNENNSHNSSSLNAWLSQLSNMPNNVTNAGNNELVLSNGTASGQINRSLLGFSEFSDAEVAGSRLRCGIWITFVLASTFVAAAKFYFGYRGPGLEILVFCGLLLLLLTACLYSIFCRAVHSHARPEHRMQEDHIVALTSDANVSIDESMRPMTVPTTVRQNPLTTTTTTVRQTPPTMTTVRQNLPTATTTTVRQNPSTTTTVRQNPPPPPYHIAILIPPPDISDLEAPPPSYDKIMR